MDNFNKHLNWYQSAGYRVFPVVGKNPLLGFKWKTTTATPAQWDQATGIGLITGPTFCVVDIDTHVKGCPGKGDPSISCSCLSSDAILDLLGNPSTITCATPTGGLHLYFADPTNAIGNSVKALHPQVDTRGQGKGYVVLPPSIHPNGKPYRWLVPPLKDQAFPTVPPAIVKAMAAHNKEKRDYTGIFTNGAPDGSRNDACVSLAGALWHLLATKSSQVNKATVHDITETLLFWDKRNTPPLGPGTIRSTVESIGKSHYGHLESKRDSQSRESNTTGFDNGWD